ncbi:MAG: UvrD-helicase domain-containing protein [Deltaproteobacteria bacterium]|nr:UvrD-helicase domain-containing protein [Deltaproteobacteria bacterium]
MYSLDLSDLNSEQRKAVVETEKPVLLLAGAGSGKTRVITYRIAHLVANLRVPGKKILALTFTNKASKEMKERVDQLLGPKAKGILVTTFHSLCVRFLREYIHLLGFNKNFVIFDTTSQLSVIKNVFDELELDEGFFKPKPTFYEIMKVKGKGLGPEYYLNQKNDPDSQIKGKIFQQYNKTLKSCNALDFEDILYFTLDLFKRFPEELSPLTKRFDYVMVDEYQDTNRIQYQLVKILIERTQKICVVGDDDQSIYGWRGADIRNILDFKKDYPQAVVIPLEQNYRSTHIILKAANDVISNNSDRMEKSLWTQDKKGASISWIQRESTEEELDEVVYKMRCYKDDNIKKWSDFSFLYRSNFQSRAIEEVLRNAGIPYQLIGGIKFFDRKEIQDCLAYMKFLHNLNDEISLLRVINYPKRGIGISSIGSLNEARMNSDFTLFEMMEQAEGINGLNSRAKNNFRSFVALIREFKEKLDNEPFYEVFKELFERVGLKDEIERDEKNEELRERKVNNFLEFLNTLYLYGNKREGAGLIDFLDYVSLFTDTDDYDGKIEKVSLLTIHAAKGLEFDYVAITGMAEGQLPNQKALQENGLEEERRLFYVAITRARKMLSLSMADSRMMYGEWIDNQPSRFISEINPDLFDTKPFGDEDPAYKRTSAKQARSQFFKRFGGPS